MIEDAAPIILPSLLETFPELREGYAVMAEEARIGYECLTEQDIEDMRSIHEIHNFAPHDDSLPGYIIVLENLLVPLIIELSKSRQKSGRLIEAMQWVEHMAVSTVFAVSNGIACGVCEPLITNHSAHLPGIVPFMGSTTKGLCTMQFPEYRIDEATKRLFS